MMNMIPTPHIEVVDKSTIAKTVLMPGDPLRAEYIAKTYLTDSVQFNNVRGMKGFTGKYRGQRVSVMGSGMGMPSMGIYSYELFAFYDVDNIIRIGSCGAYAESLKLYDVLLVEEAWSESTYAKVQSGYDGDTISSSEVILKSLIDSANRLDIPIERGRIHSSDVFYKENFLAFECIRDEHDCIAVEMESFALFANAKLLNKNAGCILTVSDSLVSGEMTTAQERQNSFTKMMEIALDSVLSLS